MMDGELPAGQCVRGPIPVAEPTRGSFDAAVLDTRTGGLGLPADLQVLVAWVLESG